LNQAQHLKDGTSEQKQNFFSVKNIKKTEEDIAEFNNSSSFLQADTESAT